MSWFLSSERGSGSAKKADSWEVSKAAAVEEPGERDVHGEEYGASWQSWWWSNRETFRCWFRSVVPKLLTNLRPVYVNSMIPSINLIIKFVACVFAYLTVGMFFTGFSGQKVWFEKSSFSNWGKN